MYYLFEEDENGFAPHKLGEFVELKAAQKKAKEIKAKDPSISYTIEENTGGFNSYGEPLMTVVERG